MKRSKFLFIAFIFLISSIVYADKSTVVDGIKIWNMPLVNNRFISLNERNIWLDYNIRGDYPSMSQVSIYVCTEAVITSSAPSTKKRSNGTSYKVQEDIEIINTGQQCWFTGSSYDRGRVVVFQFKHNYEDLACSNFSDDPNVNLCYESGRLWFSISSSASFQLIKYRANYDRPTISSSNMDGVTKAIDKTREEQKKQHEESEKTRKGILKTIIELPKKLVNLIIDGLKNLFIPKDGFINDKLTELLSFIRDKLGILFYPFELISDFFNMIIDFCKPGDGILEIPTIKEPFSGVILIEGVSYNFGKDFKIALGKYYSLYQSFVYGICILLFSKFLYNYYLYIVEGKK